MSGVLTHRPSAVGPGRRRFVAYCRVRRIYLSHDCLGETQSRAWAWSGTREQASRMMEVYPMAQRFTLYADGDERGPAPSD